MHADRLFAKATMRTRMLLLHVWRKLLIMLTSTSQVKLYGMGGTACSADAHHRRRIAGARVQKIGFHFRANARAQAAGQWPGEKDSSERSLVMNSSAGCPAILREPICARRRDCSSGPHRRRDDRSETHLSQESASVSGKRVETGTRSPALIRLKSPWLTRPRRNQNSEIQRWRRLERSAPVQATRADIYLRQLMPPSTGLPSSARPAHWGAPRHAP